MTKVVNFLGGPGLGKTTTSAGLFHFMKLKGLHCELVREYVKKWAWEGKEVGIYDQLYIMGKQAKEEYSLYGKVDWIITDSPLLLSGIYDKYYNNSESCLKTVKEHIKKAEDNGVEFINIFLKRNKEYDQRGRYQTEEQAREVDNFLLEELKRNNIHYFTVDCEDYQKPHEVMNIIGV